MKPGGLNLVGFYLSNPDLHMQRDHLECAKISRLEDWEDNRPNFWRFRLCLYNVKWDSPIDSNRPIKVLEKEIDTWVSNQPEFRFHLKVPRRFRQSHQVAQHHQWWLFLKIENIDFCLNKWFQKLVLKIAMTLKTNIFIEFLNIWQYDSFATVMEMNLNV